MTNELVVLVFDSHKFWTVRTVISAWLIKQHNGKLSQMNVQTYNSGLN